MQHRTAQYTLEVISLFGEYEALLSELYLSFSENSKEYKPFWLRLASDEASHSKLFERLKHYAQNDFVRMPYETKLKKEQIISQLEDLKTYIKRSKEYVQSEKRSIAIAKSLEEGILEREAYSFFETENTEAREIVQQYVNETKAHSAALDTLIIKKSEYSLLVSKGVVSEIQIELAGTIARKTNVGIESVLMSRFRIPRQSILENLADRFKVKSFDLKGVDISLPDDIIKKMLDKYDVLKSKLYVPVFFEKNHLRVVMANPIDLYLRDDIQMMFDGMTVEYLVSIPDDILEAIDKLLQDKNHTREMSFINVLPKIDSAAVMQTPAPGAQEDEISEEDSTIVKFVNLVIEDAYKRGASDIHFENVQNSHAIIRYRIDGQLIKTNEFPYYFNKAVVSRIKIMSNLDIAEKRKPQSGKIAYKRWGMLDLELRVETYPTIGESEDAVLRLLSASKPLPFDELDMNTANIEKMKKLAVTPYGLLLCVGPTGSGKTTTLHSALGYINDEKRKILTVEDPVEITQPGLRQIQVNRKAGVDFGVALRSFLRADPDVIMIGEMRDFETANIAVEASLTGHMVFSTLHTNSAPETITRLLDIGLDSYSFADALLGVLAQRLVRKLCSECRIKLNGDGKHVEMLAAEYGNPEAFSAFLAGRNPEIYKLNTGGCDVCSKSGQKGRMAIHEFLVVSDDIRKLIAGKATVADIREQAIREGMTTLKQDGIEKVLAGQTTIENVHAVCNR